MIARVKVFFVRRLPWNQNSWQFLPTNEIFSNSLAVVWSNISKSSCPLHLSEKSMRFKFIVKSQSDEPTTTTTPFPNDGGDLCRQWLDDKIVETRALILAFLLSYYDLVPTCVPLFNFSHVLFVCGQKHQKVLNVFYSSSQNYKLATFFIWNHSNR